jgi:hypothetical protein
MVALHDEAQAASFLLGDWRKQPRAVRRTTIFIRTSARFRFPGRWRVAHGRNGPADELSWPGPREKRNAAWVERCLGEAAQYADEIVTAVGWRQPYEADHAPAAWQTGTQLGYLLEGITGGCRNRPGDRKQPAERAL